MDLGYHCHRGRQQRSCRIYRHVLRRAAPRARGVAVARAALPRLTACSHIAWGSSCACGRVGGRGPHPGSSASMRRPDSKSTLCGLRGGGGGVIYIFGDLSLYCTGSYVVRGTSPRVAAHLLYIILSSFCCDHNALTCATACVKMGMSHARETYWPADLPFPQTQW